MRLGLAPGARVAFLTANRADTWCAGVAAQLSRLAITWLHPLGSLEDQLFQIEDSDAEMLVIDAATFRDRGGDLAAKASGLKTVFTLGPANYGADLLAAVEDAGTASPRCFAGPDDISTLNYTGGTTGKSKGALRYHREAQRLRRRDPGRLRNSRHPALSHGGADQPRRRHQGAADADARRHRAHAQGLRSGGGVEDHRARAHQFHAVRADHDLRAARPSRARQDRSLLARTAALRRVGDVAEPAGRGHRADRPGVLAALRPDRMLSGLGAAQGRPRSEDAGTVPVLRFPDRRLRGEDPRRRRPGGRNRRGRRDLRARAACDGRILEAARNRPPKP